MAGKNLSPQAWVRYWYLGFVLGIGCLVAGIATGDALLIFLGVVVLVFTPAMIAFWRRQRAQEPPTSN